MPVFVLVSPALFVVIYGFMRFARVCEWLPGPDLQRVCLISFPENFQQKKSFFFFFFSPWLSFPFIFALSLSLHLHSPTHTHTHKHTMTTQSKPLPRLSHASTLIHPLCQALSRRNNLLDRPHLYPPNSLESKRQHQRNTPVYRSFFKHKTI